MMPALEGMVTSSFDCKFQSSPFTVWVPLVNADFTVNKSPLGLMSVSELLLPGLYQAYWQANHRATEDLNGKILICFSSNVFPSNVLAPQLYKVFIWLPALLNQLPISSK